MKTFKDFLQKGKEKTNWLSWKNSFAEMRKEKEQKPNDKKKIKESEDHEDEKPLEHTGKSGKNYHGISYDSIHLHKDIRPQKANQDHVESMRNFSRTKGEEDDISEPNHAHSSRIMNPLLRHIAEKKKGTSDTEGHSVEEVKKGIHQLSSAFTKENTNRKAVTTYTGVPKHIGEKIEKSKPGTKHTFSGFTSTSTDKHTAKEFAETHAEEKDDLDSHRHVIKFHAQPVSLLSIAPHSKHEENEMVAHHGAHATYSHTTTEGNYKIHHMTLHSTHEKIPD